MKANAFVTSQTGSRPAEHLDTHPVGIEDEERVVALFVAILLRREVNPRATRQASLVGGVHVIPAFDLKGEMLDTDVVVAVGAAIGRAQPNPSAVVRVNQVDDLLGAAVGGIANRLGQPERPQQVEVERQRRVDVGNGEIDVMDASRCHFDAPFRDNESARPTGR